MDWVVDMAGDGGYGIFLEMEVRDKVWGTRLRNLVVLYPLPTMKELTFAATGLSFD